MAQVADYILFKDSITTMQHSGGTSDAIFEKNIVETPVSGEGALLMWNVRRTGSGSVTYEVRINDIEGETKTYTATVGDWVAVHEVMDTPSIKTGLNKVEFQVTAGTALLNISDVVLFFRQET